MTILFTTDIQAQWSVIHNTIVGETTNDFSGASVDLSGDGKTIVVGATSNDGNGSNAGHVRVYKFNDRRCRNGVIQ